MPTFVQSGVHELAQLRARVETFIHTATGSRHVHFDVDDAESAFLIAFPTLPSADDGRAHILEHLLLCGSQRFPVRNPFFAMMNRSMATFMNAMTYPDMTVYPFATTNRVDFFNLMDVYLDATFFPLLSRLDFLQEGWRAELKDNEISLHGVVLSEMKSKVTEPAYALHRGLYSALFPGSIYAFNSGGDPLDIPNLTHEALVEFHRVHYHPSQALFMSWGRVDPLNVQERIEQQVLSRYQDRHPVLRVQRPAIWMGERRATLKTPANAASMHEHRLQLAWRLGPASDLASLARTRLLQSVLLDSGGGLLRQAIESLGFGRLSEYHGVDSSTTEILFHVGIAGLKRTEIELAHISIRDAMQKIAGRTDWRPQLQDSLRQVRYAERHSRRGYQRLIALAQTGLRHEDMLRALDSEAILQGLAAEIDNPDFLSRQLFTLLHDMPCLVAEVNPDPRVISQREELARQWTDAYASRLSDADRQALLAEGEALKVHQKTQPASDVLSALPRVTLGDVDPLPRQLLTLSEPCWQDHSFPISTTGLSHAWVKVDASALDEADWPWLDLYAALLPQLGALGMGHQAASHWRRARVGQFQATCDSVEMPGAKVLIEFSLRVDALLEDQSNIPSVLAAWFAAPMLDAARLSYLIDNLIRQRLAGLGQAVPSMAVLDTREFLSGAARYKQRVAGLPSLKFLAMLKARLTTDEGCRFIAGELARIQAFLVSAPCVLMSAGPERQATDLLENLQHVIDRSASDNLGMRRQTLTVPSEARPGRGLLMPAQVNHCVTVWQVPDMTHPDAPALLVLAELVQSNLLHPKLREQGGAYGTQASYSAPSGAFSMLSMADPRLAATFTDMQGSLEELQIRAWSFAELEQAKLSAVRRLDPISLGAAEVETAWMMARQGLTPACRKHLRQGVLGCTLAQVLVAATDHLTLSRMRQGAAIGWSEQPLAGLEVVDVEQHIAALGLGDPARR